MGFWPWFWIWVALALVALVFFAAIGYNLFLRGAAVLRQASKLAPIAEKLQAALDAQPDVAKPSANLHDDPKLHVQARKQLLRSKAKKREERQRRLIKHLNQFDPTESRFQ
jgi:hypothetical protein